MIFKNQHNNRLEIQYIRIHDTPILYHCGFMLDVARHFQPVETIKHLIDIMVSYKLNILHLHITDDQGWRLEINSWPMLHQIGAHSSVGGGSGGYYTQAEYKEIIEYARERSITVIPEIDLPSHTYAAIASYPWLASSKSTTPSSDLLDNPSKESALPLYTGIEVGFSCVNLQDTYALSFVTDVLQELVALTPGKYIHIGGDEPSKVCTHQEYVDYMTKIVELVISMGKTPIGWQEISALSSHKQTTILQYWNQNDKSTTGFKTILSPANKTS